MRNLILVTLLASCSVQEPKEVEKTDSTKDSTCVVKCVDSTVVKADSLAKDTAK